MGRHTRQRSKPDISPETGKQILQGQKHNTQSKHQRKSKNHKREHKDNDVRAQGCITMTQQCVCVWGGGQTILHKDSQVNKDQGK